MAGAALATSLYTGDVRGANDRISAAFIGMGKMGRTNLGYAMRPEISRHRRVRHLPPNLNVAVEMAAQGPAARKGQGLP